MRKATNLDMALIQHAMIQRDTLDYMASNDQQKAKDLVTRLTMAVTDQLVKDGRGNEESSTVLSQFGVVMVGVDTPDYFHFVTKQKNIGPDIEPGYVQLKAEKGLEAHMFLHQRNFNAAVPTNLRQSYMPYAYCVPMRVSKKKD